MSDNTQQKSSFSASDIEKYLKGELSAPQMHELEKAALEDPFLADAMEGMEKHYAPLHKDLDDLRERLQKRITGEEKDQIAVPLLQPAAPPSQPPVVPLLQSPVARTEWKPVWKMAAVFILLIGLGGITYLFLLNKGKTMPSFAKQENKQERIQDVQPSQHATKPQSDFQSDSNTQKQQAKKAQSSSNKKPPSNTNPSLNGKISSEAVSSSQAAVSSEAAAITKAPENFSRDLVSGLKITPNQDKIPDSLTPLNRSLTFKTPPPSSPNTANYSPGNQANNQANGNRQLPTAGQSATDALDLKPLEGKLAGYSGSKKITPATAFSVSGKVVDQNNKPLSGVNLSLNGRNKGNVVTDNNGEFNLRFRRQDSSARLVVTSLGYQAVSMALNTENRVGNVIQLKPENASLNEVVVIGYGSKKRKNFAEEETLDKIKADPSQDMETLNRKTVPVAGWSEYKNYLEKNKGAGITDSTIKGVEILSFLVDKKGELSSFKIEKSLSAVHDSALIHLVQQGPSWKLLKGKKARATVTLSF